MSSYGGGDGSSFRPGFCRYGSLSNCKFGSRCKFRHDPNAPSMQTSSSSSSSSFSRNKSNYQSISRAPDDTKRFVQHLWQLPAAKVGDQIKSSWELWLRCWRDHAAFDDKTLGLLVEVLARIPKSSSAGPPPVHHWKDALLLFLAKTAKRGEAQQILRAAETANNVVGRLVEFEWDCSKDDVKDALCTVLVEAEGILLKKNKDHRDASQQLMVKLEDLDKPWRIRVKSQPDSSASSSSVGGALAEPDSCGDWQRATVKWLSNPKLFSPSSLPAMNVPLKTSTGVYESSTEYMETIYRLWIGMTFYDGYAALAPHCRSRGPAGTSCQRALWPVAYVDSGKLRCRTRGCNGVVEFACKTKAHDALCARCAARAFLNNMGGPGSDASTHIYDAKVTRQNPDGHLYLSGVKSRNPPMHQIHWGTSKRLQNPNLVGVVKLRSKDASLAPQDLIKWGEIVCHDNPRDEGRRRQQGELSIDLSTIVTEYDHENIEEGTYVAVIDCMAFVPEWIPVLHALEKQRQGGLPFEDGRFLNLWRDHPCDNTNSVLTGSSPKEVFAMDVDQLIEFMIDNSKLDPIREIRRDPELRDVMSIKLAALVKQTTLDNMQLVSFVDALLNPVHLTQGPPGTGKSYLGVVLVRALITIRDIWVKYSKTVGSHPILVLSYKNHAIDEFLVDLVRAEAPSAMFGKLVRIGGQCKDPRLVAYSERTAFRSDIEVDRNRRQLDTLFGLQESIQVTMENNLSSLLAYRHDMFEDFDGPPAEAHKARTKAANEATDMLMEALARRSMLMDALAELEDEPPVDDASTGNVSDTLAFLRLNAHRGRSLALQAVIDKTESERFIEGLVHDFAHYRVQHWGDILLSWISGKVPLPPCSFKSGDGTPCERLGTSPDLPLCSKHRCRFHDEQVQLCTSPSVSETKPYCVHHLCSFADCSRVRFGSMQLFCKNHGCKKCFELGKVSGPATDDPPRNACTEHPMCRMSGCLEFCENDYCEKHRTIQCLATTKKGTRCKGKPMSRAIPYCRNHLDLATSTEGNLSDDDDESQDEQQDIQDDICHAKTRKGKPCKGVPLPGSRYCYDHSPPEARFSTRKSQTDGDEKTNDVQDNHGENSESHTDGPIEVETTKVETTTPGSIIFDNSNKGIMLEAEAADEYQPSSVSDSGAVNDKAEARVDLEPDETEIEDEEIAEHIQHLRDIFEVQDGNADFADDPGPGEDVDSDESSNNGVIPVEPMSLPVCDPTSWSWKMSHEERWLCCQSLMDEQKSHLLVAARLLKEAVQFSRKELKKASIRAKARLYENRSVIGGTIVGCVSRLDSIRSVRPFAVVVEEASEVLEPLLFSCLCDSTMKLEMIGDHRQLQPSIMSRYDFQLCNHINISMFQRLIEASSCHAVPSSVLSIQRRMRRNICDLTRDYYKDIVEIEDHERCGVQLLGEREGGSKRSLVDACSTKGREVPGVSPHIFLWTHKGEQKKAQVGLSKINDHEAKMACSLATYLVECGVPKTSITILTPYKGQLMLIRKMLLNEPQYRISGSKLFSMDGNDTDVCRLSTVDRFQGDESDVVIASLVVDEKSKTTFVQLVNRLVVLLSRARLAMYLLANLGYFKKNSEGAPKHWAKLFEMLENPSVSDSPGVSEFEVFGGSRVGNEIPLCCPLHRDVTLCVAEPSKLKLGFCHIPCKHQLLCGHECSLPCHWPRLQHNSNCQKQVVPPCPIHPNFVSCHFIYKNSPSAPFGLKHVEVLKFFKCPAAVKVALHCGHIISRPCWEEREISSGKLPWPVCKEQSPTPFFYPSCQHTINGTCNDIENWTNNPATAPKCQARVSYNPPCGHSVEISCTTKEDYESNGVPYKCSAKEQFELPRCGHTHVLSCNVIQRLLDWSGKSCNEVGKVVENVTYGPKDYVCKEIVTFARVCGHSLNLPCEEAFSRSCSGGPCNVPVRTWNRHCGHRCQVPCAEAIALANIPVPDPMELLVEGAISLPNPALPRSTCKVIVKLTRTCGHSIDIECRKAARPLAKCSVPTDLKSPLCSHSVAAPCHLREALGRLTVWQPDVGSSDVATVSKFAIEIDEIDESLKTVLLRCDKSFPIVLECGHKREIKCSKVLDFLGKDKKEKCVELVSLCLPCGHSVEVTCDKAKSFTEGIELLICPSVIGKKCWNFSTCSQILQAPCSHQGLVACQAISKWTCLKGKHSYDLDLCSNGVPQDCPGCQDDDISDFVKDPSPLPNFFDTIFPLLQDGTVVKFAPMLSNFYSVERIRLNDFLSSIDGVPIWKRQLCKVHRVPCFIHLTDSTLLNAEAFDPTFSKQSTLYGILVREFTAHNLFELAKKKERTDEIILLVGFASVIRTHRESGLIPEGKSGKKTAKKIESYSKRLQIKGYDSVAFTDRVGFRSLIIWDPYPLVAVGRMRLCPSDLLNLAEQLEPTPMIDYFPSYVERNKPNETLLLLSSLGDGPVGNLGASEETNSAATEEIAELLNDTSLEGFRVSLRMTPHQIDSNGVLPQTIERDLKEKLRFFNSNASPFGGIELLKTAMKAHPSPLLDLLWAAELAFHDKLRAKEPFAGYLDHARESIHHEVHPWALIVSARLHERGAKKLLSAFVSCFPAATHLLTKDELDEQTDAILDVPNKQYDDPLEAWDEIKNSNPNISSKATDDLLALIGLRKVKEVALRLWNSALQLGRMEPEARKVNMITANYIFLGNPGTGKTTVARLFAQMLLDCGLRATNVIEETTAQQSKDGGVDEFRKTIQRATGGCLFIDEAYDIDPVNDSKGKPIVNELLTLCENDRDKISVILAGYADDFQNKFFSYNPGLRSRFTEVLFEDFDESELKKIWTFKRKEKRWEEGPGVCDVVVKKISKMSGHKGFGNGREVRKRLESATQAAMSRLGDSFSMATMKLETVDVIGEDPRNSLKLQRILQEVNGKIGWGRVKKSIKELVDLCGVNYHREIEGKPALDIFLNRLFLGNPGTGKTTCAKIYGRLLKELGYGDVVSKTAGDFVGEHVGQSQNKTINILEGAKGKVLIIDEAYVLDDGLYGKQVLDTLVEKVQGGPSDDMAVLLLGYEEQMLKMIRSQNPGLARRFPKDYAFYFDDYTDSELLEILKFNLEAQKLSATLEFKVKAIDVLSMQRKQANFGNAGSVELLIKGALQKASKRFDGASQELLESDIEDPGLSRGERDADPLAKLDGLFGMEKVRLQLEKMRKSWTVSKREGSETPELGHFVFVGSPGTGKTTVARALAQILFGLSLLPTGKIVETSALDLTAGYVGQTKDKVNESLRDAKGGVLFIDEAYNLGLGPFGVEACDTIVAAMTSEEFRDVVIVIAGYPAEINEMLNTNAGLKSRFTHFFEFPDWEPDDCVGFFTALSEKENFTIDVDVLNVLRIGCAELQTLDGWGNGRDVKKLWEETKSQRASRVFESSELAKTIQLSDLNEAMNSMLHARRPKVGIQPKTNRSEVLLENKKRGRFDQEKYEGAQWAAMDTKQHSSTRQTENLKTSHDEAGNDDQDDVQGQEESLAFDDRDEGITDEVWNELKDAKRKEKNKIDELEKLELALADFLEQQKKENEEARRRLEAELERIERELQEQERELAIRKAREEEEERKRVAEMERKRREEALHRRQAELRRVEAIQTKLRSMGPCPMGFNWHKVGGGWRCAGGSHYVSDDQVAFWA